MWEAPAVPCANPRFCFISSAQKAAEDTGEDRHLLEACSRRTGQRNTAIADRNVGGDLAEQRGRIHRDFGKAQTKAGNGVQRQQVACVRRTSFALPAMLVE